MRDYKTMIFKKISKRIGWTDNTTKETYLVTYFNSSEIQNQQEVWKFEKILLNFVFTDVFTMC